jgi:predicted transcriptional regulator YheO
MDILRQHYLKLARFLGELMGPDYEVALYDLTLPEPSVIALAGNVSGRKLGSPLSDMAAKLIENKSYMNMDSKVNYVGVGAGGKMLRCSVFFIKDEDGMPFGLLSVAFDDSRYHELSDRLLKLRHPDEFVESHFVYSDESAWQADIDADEAEAFKRSVDSLFAKMLEQAEAAGGMPPDRLTSAEKQDFIQQLKDAGIFELKHAIPKVAKTLHCSPATVYRYLARCKP